MTSITDKLNSLWLDLAAQKSSTQDSTPSPKVQTEFKFKAPVQCFQCIIENCVECCCLRKGQKIRLLLSDLATLLDHGYADQITGKYGTKQEVEKFLKSPSSENIYKTPYLKRKKVKTSNDACVFLTKDLKCSIWDKAPFICRTYPLYMEQEMTSEKMILTFSLDKLCSCAGTDRLKTVRPKEYTQRIMNDVIAERIEADRTTKLLCYKREDLKKIGLAKYL